jgi:uncharacterized RDD family membrane protein YckC
MDETSTDDQWTTEPGRPLRRLVARAFDNSVVGTIAWWLVGFFAFAFGVGDPLVGLLGTFWGRMIDAMLTLVLMIPIHAATIGLTGGSPGKWLCGIQVRRPDGSSLGFGMAFIREIKVWLLGYAAGIPLITLLALVNAGSTIRDSGVADWDEAEDSVVSYAPLTPARQGMIGVATVVLLIMISWGVIERFAGFAQL